jgi:hypothetical protein
MATPPIKGALLFEVGELPIRRVAFQSSGFSGTIAAISGEVFPGGAASPVVAPALS